MKKRTLLSILILSNFASNAQIKLPRLISDGMVLQRSTEVKLWGWASPKEKIKLSFNRKEYFTQANDSGNWEIKLPAQKAGGPYEMVFTASNKISLKDILFGDVWLGSGQSNMELPMSRLVDQYPDVIAKANQNAIRQFLVPDEYDFNVVRKDFSNGSWVAATPKNVLDFSAAAYFFAVALHKKYQVPIGIINAALGGSPAQSWISEASIKQFPAYFEEEQKFKNNELIKQIETADQLASNNWYKSLNANDAGLKENWKLEVDTKDWKEMEVPGYWANTDLGKVNGVVWFKKEIEVPKSMLNRPVKLLLGRIVDADSVFVNEKYVGSTGYQYPPRRYLFNAGVLKEGKNTITIRIVNNSGNGGFVLDKAYQLIAGIDTLDLRGKWKYQLGAKMGPTPSQTFIRWKPVGLYNAMIAPLQPYKLKGVLWYQGEANTGNASEYSNLMQQLIADWRRGWGEPNLPFLYVQLPNFMEAKKEPSVSNWAALREQQRHLAQVVPHTAMAVAIDLGEWNDIHPLNKKDVGNRLALLAEHLVYGNNKIVYSGPVFSGMTANNKQLVLEFTNIGSGLLAKNGNVLKHFAIAGADKQFVWANAAIKDNIVVVWNNSIAKPMYVRYAWADNPEGANLYNKEGLPASPFEAVLK